MSGPNVSAERVGLALTMARAVIAEDVDLQQAVLGAIGSREDIAATMIELIVFVTSAAVAERNGGPSGPFDLAVVDRQLEVWQGTLRQALGSMP